MISRGWWQNILLVGVFFLIGESAHGELFNSRSKKSVQDSLTGAFNINEPPEYLAESTYIKFAQDRGFTNAPYPLERLRDEMAYAEMFPISMLVPKGRSAQKDNTDKAKPRRVFASYFPNKIGPRFAVGQEDYSSFGVRSPLEGRLFFGHAERANQIEVLSFNPKGRDGKARYDYLEITGYGTSSEQVREVLDRDRCTKCHQGEAGIFPPQPWTEMMSHNPLSYEAKTEKPQFFKADPTLYSEMGITLSIQETPFANNTGLGIGIASFTSNLLLQAYRIVDDLCTKDVECRKYMVLAAVLNPNFSEYIHLPLGGGPQPLDFDFGLPTKKLNELRSKLPQGLNASAGFFQKWNKENYAYPNEFIPDLSDLSSGKITPQQAEPTTTREKVRGVPPDVAPMYLYDVAFEYFGLTKEESDEIKAISEEERRDRIANLNYSIWPIKSQDIMTALRGGKSTLVSFTGIEGTEKVSYAEVAPLFKKYCIRCHQAGNSDGNPVIPFEGENGLLSYGQSNSLFKIYGRLQNKSMPPQGEIAPSDQENNQMKNYLATINTVNPGRPALLPKAYINALNVRVLARYGHGFSYVIPKGSVNILNETVSSSCGRFTPDSEPTQKPQLPIGLASDGRSYLALENFPGSVPGSIVQAGYLLDFSGACSPIGLTRNGALTALLYSKNLKKWASVTLNVKNGNTPALKTISMPLSGSITPKSLFYFALGTDNKLYRIGQLDFRRRTFEVEPLSLGDNNSRLWSRIGYDSETDVVYLEGAEGLNFAYRFESTKKPLTPIVLPSDVDLEKYYPASLLDRTGLVAVPRVYVAKRGTNAQN